MANNSKQLTPTSLSQRSDRCFPFSLQYDTQGHFPPSPGQVIGVQAPYNLTRGLRSPAASMTYARTTSLAVDNLDVTVQGARSVQYPEHSVLRRQCWQRLSDAGCTQCTAGGGVNIRPRFGT
jgi:hypothetical protein